MDEYVDYNADIDLMYADSLLYSEGVQLVAHNSFSSIEDGFTLHPQQHFDVKHQFKYGARGFMIDVYDSSNGHTLLLHKDNLRPLSGLGSSTTKTFYFEDYLEDIQYLLQKYTKSIVTLIIENGKSVDSNKIKNALDRVGLGGYLLTKNPNNGNVTFGYMRSAGERLVVFLENGPQIVSDNIYTTAYYKETTYSLDMDQKCIDRQEGRVPFADSEVKVFVLNHFHSMSCNENLGVTSIAKNKCSTVNDYNRIVERFELCKKTGNIPTFIGVDFIEHGDNGGPLKAIGIINSLNDSDTMGQIDSDIPIISHNSLCDDLKNAWIYLSELYYSKWYFNLEKFIIFLAGFGIGFSIYKCCCTCITKLFKRKVD